MAALSTATTPELSLIGYNRINGVAAADGVNALGPVWPSSTSAPGKRLDDADRPTSVNVDAAKTGLYDLHFQAPADARLARPRCAISWTGPLILGTRTVG